MADAPGFDIEEMKMRLFARRKQLLHLKETSEEMQDPADTDPARVGRLTRMDAIQGQAMAAETARRRDVEIERIVAALARIEDGEFGWCVGCGEAIAPKRLENDPAAPNCIGCAGKAGG